MAASFGTSSTKRKPTEEVWTPMLPIADTLASLGSRLCIIFDPVEKRILYARFGRFEDLPVDLAVGVRLKSGVTYALPFTQRYDAFEFVEQAIGMNSIVFQEILLVIGYSCAGHYVKRQLSPEIARTAAGQISDLLIQLPGTR